jgi:hypothetical protein
MIIIVAVVMKWGFVMAWRGEHKIYFIQCIKLRTEKGMSELAHWYQKASEIAL